MGDNMGLIPDLQTIKVGTFLFLQMIFGRKQIPFFWSRFGSVGEVTIPSSAESMSICTKHGEITIRALDSLIFHVTFRRDRDPQYVTCSAEDRPAKRLRVERENGLIRITTEDDENALMVEIREADSAVRFLLKDRVLHFERISAGFSGKWVSCIKETHEPELVCGMGQKTGGIFKNGKRLVMWNNDNPRLNRKSDPIYQSCPFQINVRSSDGSGHGIFYDNTNYSIFKCGALKKRKPTSYYAKGGPLSYYVFGGPSVAQVTEQFTYITGRYKLPPLWILGHHHARWEDNESAERIIGIARGMRSRNIPCDAIHVDIGHMEGYRCFTWNKKRFPDPRGFIQSMHELGFRVVLISDPGLKKDESWDIYKEGVARGYFCKDQNGKICHAPVWPGASAFPDYTSPEVRQWWGDLYKSNIEEGADGFWNDMNEPSLFTCVRTLPANIVHKGGGSLPQMTHERAHNIYGLLMARATREGVDRLRPDVRPFVFTRSSFAGIQRYASSWTGDNTSNWEHLALSIPMILNMGLSGQVMTGPDIGGFWHNTNAELLTRWMEAGVLYPFSRNHTSLGTINQEIWEFGKVTEEICKKYLALRYSLLPYIYTCFRESALTGIPFMKPLFLEFPHDPRCRESRHCETEYIAGHCFLVAPVLTQGSGKRSVYFPAGADWYDFFTGEKYAGGSEHTVIAPLDKLPLYARSESAIPIAENCTSVPASQTSRLALKVYPGKSISGNLYIDDGESYEYKNGGFSFIRINGGSWEEETSFAIERIEGNLTPEMFKYPVVSLAIHSFGRKITNALVNEKPVNFTQASTGSGDEWITLEDCSPSLPIRVVLKTKK
jgi:alpha-glucosidase